MMHPGFHMNYGPFIHPQMASAVVPDEIRTVFITGKL